MGKRTLIAGCGYVGIALARELATDPSAVVFALRRNPTALDVAQPNIIPLAADLSQAPTLADLPTELDAVVYASSASARTDDGYRAAYVEGPRHLLDALGRQGQAPRFVFVSSTSVYQDASDLPGQWVDEDTPVAPRSFTGQHLRAGEELVFAAPLPSVVVRFGGIYGPGRERLIDSVRTGRAQLQGVPTWTNRIHRDDCAGVLAHLLARDQHPEPALYVGVDNQPTAYDEVLMGLAELLGVAAPSLAGPAEPTERAAARRALRANKRCRNARLRASGYSFRFPTWREGYTALLQSHD